MPFLSAAEVIDLVLQAFYRVYNRLDYGFLERVYLCALVIELRKLGLHVLVEAKVPVMYDGNQVGFYRPDLIVNGCVVVEIKALGSIPSHSIRQVRNSLRCSRLSKGIVLNFGLEPVYHIETISVRR